MNPNENSDLTAANLIALRTQPDALQIITERLKVKQMGPADHIRTKHEVKAFIESVGDIKEAEAIVARARARRSLQQAQSVTMTMTHQQTLPEGIKRFGLIEGVWVTDYASVLPLASSLRFTLQQLAIAKLSQEGAKEKMAILYSYLVGAEFRQRVERVIEAFTSMREDVDAEKRALTKHWAKREKQLAQVVENMASIFGDIQGISGSALPDILVPIPPNSSPARWTRLTTSVIC
jgi:hypothetical protein